jgi:hypothetical protein
VTDFEFAAGFLSVVVDELAEVARSRFPQEIELFNRDAGTPQRGHAHGLTCLEQFAAGQQGADNDAALLPGTGSSAIWRV